MSAQYHTRLPDKPQHDRRTPMTVATELAQLWSRYAQHQSHNACAFWQDYSAKLPERACADPMSWASWWTDTAQRSVLFWNTLRQRGNNYIEHSAAGNPPVLAFAYETVLDGADFPKPVNHSLVRILPPKGMTIDAKKRPFVIVDPRAGHGPGIGGFKDDSQVGIALRAGHPVYFVVFKPHPVPGQTLSDVAQAEARFLSHVAAAHPDAPKAAVYGNCQGGWAIMAVAAQNPDIAGPMILSGAPLAYWAGETGKNPMRYLGGLVGGSWVSVMLGDLGHGQFDGANLVSNFESLDLANTYWSKYHNLFSKIDTETGRFLDFERWWGGYTLMTTEEIRAIVDNLFVGNKLSRGQITVDGAQVIDLKRITQPIVVFCSAGDNITPPQQALNWIADLYEDENQIKAAGQTIVYLIHETTGHLGIFVSSKISRREQMQIVSTLEQIESLPPGLYEMTIRGEDETRDVRLEERSIRDLLAEGGARQCEDAEFELVKTISQYNALGYELLISPLVRAASSEWSAELRRQMHPLRVSHWGWSDLNPLTWPLPMMAECVRQMRHVADGDSAPSRLAAAQSYAIEFGLDSLRDFRDIVSETLFYGVYGMLTSLGAGARLAALDRGGARREDARTEALVESLLAEADKGDADDALLRILLLLIKARGFLDRSEIDLAQKHLDAEGVFSHLPPEELRRRLHRQTVIVGYDADRALSTLPALLPDAQTRGRVAMLVERLGIGVGDDETAAVLALWERIETALDAGKGKIAV